jgi:hypothetical protein
VLGSGVVVSWWMGLDIVCARNERLWECLFVRRLGGSLAIKAGGLSCLMVGFEVGWEVSGHAV